MHTSGEWIYVADEDSCYVGKIMAITEESITEIADTPEHDDRPEDFYLMAAAPELLAACEALVQWYKRGGALKQGDYYKIPDTDGFRLAVAAIAKAKGEF